MRAGYAHVRGTPKRRTHGHGRGELAVRRVETRLDEVLALRLRDERLQLGGGERVDETCLGHDEQEHLRAGECRELVRLHKHRVSMSANMMTSTRVGDARRVSTAENITRVNNTHIDMNDIRAFFMMPAFRFENVM